MGSHDSLVAPQQPVCFGEHGGLVGGQVDHAVGDDHVDGGVRQRDGLDGALDEFNVARARLRGVRPGQRQHLVGHVDPVRLACCADPAGGQQHVDAAAGAEVEHGLALVQVGDDERVAAAEARGDGLGGQRVAVGVRVQLGAPPVAELDVLHDAVGTRTATGRSASGVDGGRGGGVAVPHAVAQVVGLLAHGVLPAVDCFDVCRYR